MRATVVILLMLYMATVARAQPMAMPAGTALVAAVAGGQIVAVASPDNLGKSMRTDGERDGIDATRLSAATNLASLQAKPAESLVQPASHTHSCR